VAKSESARVQAMAVANIDVLFERSVLGWTKPDSEKSADIAGIHRFFTSMPFGDRTLMVKLTVKETIRVTDNNTLYTVEAVDVIKKAPEAHWKGALGLRPPWRRTA